MMTRLLLALLSDRRGTTTIEYGMLCGLIVLAILGALRGLGSESGGMWGGISSKSVAATKQANGS